MKKTISIHLMGVNFLVEESAYDLLENYLKRLKNSFQHSKDQQEICDDVESRIAELASEKISDKKHVVTFDEMKAILDTLGNPEDFEGSMDSENSEDKNEFHSESRKSRRLFRDGENKSIAGVCSGLAAYFDIDVVYLRIAFVVFFFLGGFIVPVYIVLWIAVPQARTNVERLQMQGKPINIETLKEEVKDAANNFKKSAKNFEREIKNSTSHTRKRMSEVGGLFSKIAGAILLTIGGIGLISVIALAFGEAHTQINESSALTVKELTNFFMIDNVNSFYLWLGFILLSFSILISIILTGTVLIFNLKSRWIKRSFSLLSLLGIIGIGLGIYQGIRLATDFRVEGKTVQNIGVISDTILFLNVLKNEDSNIEEITKLNWDDSQIILNNRNIRASGIEVEYGISPDTNYYVSQTLTARGRSSKAAVRKASSIDFEPQIIGNKVQIPAYYQYPLDDKFRNQSVVMKILIPYGKIVITDKTVIQSKDKLQSGWINTNGNYEDN
jgi:phage shock protein PspC (stress-responsive transcriptional regulator)